jgi:hypothetical protein
LHGGLGPLCKWETDPDCEYRVLPVSTIERVCAVVPHVGDDALAAWPPDYTRVVHWWVNVHNRDRAGPARGVDWLAGVPEDRTRARGDVRGLRRPRLHRQEQDVPVRRRRLPARLA